MSDLVARLRERVCYGSTNHENPNVLLERAVDTIEKLEAFADRILEVHTKAVRYKAAISTEATGQALAELDQ